MGIWRWRVVQRLFSVIPTVTFGHLHHDFQWSPPLRSVIPTATFSDPHRYFQWSPPWLCFSLPYSSDCDHYFPIMAHYFSWLEPAWTSPAVITKSGVTKGSSCTKSYSDTWGSFSWMLVTSSFKPIVFGPIRKLGNFGTPRNWNPVIFECFQSWVSLGSSFKWDLVDDKHFEPYLGVFAIKIQQWLHTIALHFVMCPPSGKKWMLVSAWMVCAGCQWHPAQNGCFVLDVTQIRHKLRLILGSSFRLIWWHLAQMESFVRDVIHIRHKTVVIWEGDINQIHRFEKS